MLTHPLFDGLFRLLAGLLLAAAGAGVGRLQRQEGQEGAAGRGRCWSRPCITRRHRRSAASSAPSGRGSRPTSASGSPARSRSGWSKSARPSRRPAAGAARPDRSQAAGRAGRGRGPRRQGRAGAGDGVREPRHGAARQGLVDRSADGAGARRRRRGARPLRPRRALGRSHPQCAVLCDARRPTPAASSRRRWSMPGRWWRPGRPAFRLARLGEKEAVVAMPETLVGRATQGEARVTLWSQPGRSYAAQAARDRADRRSGDPHLSSPNSRCPTPTTGVALGMTATLTWPIRPPTRVARLPLSALFNQGGTPSV